MTWGANLKVERQRDKLIVYDPRWQGAVAQITIPHLVDIAYCSQTGLLAAATRQGGVLLYGVLAENSSKMV
jgi:hypothetical protein